MFYSTALLAATAVFSSFANAQDNGTTDISDLSIDPNSVEFNIRQAWCRAQRNTCPVLCEGFASSNTCDPNTLEYTCSCNSGDDPAVSDYVQTIPFFVCQEYKIQCVADAPNDLDAQTACEAIECPTQDPEALTDDSATTTDSSDDTETATETVVAATETETVTSGSGTSTSDSDSDADSTDATTTETETVAVAADDSAAVNLAINYGTGALALGVLGFFGI